MVLELLRPRAVEVPIKGMKQEFQLKKVPQKIREVHSLPQIPHTLEQEERRGASGSSTSITTNFRVSLGSRNRFFRCLWTKQRIFCGLGRVHTGGERFFGVNGDVTSFDRVTP